MSDAITIHLELSGGAELLFDNVRSHQVTLQPQGPRGCDVAGLLKHIRIHLLKERPELFFSKDLSTVRPGILVLVNDADWDLLGQTDCQIKDGDTVTFISTLHGG